VDKADDLMVAKVDDLADRGDLVAVVVMIDAVGKVDLNLSKKNSKKYSYKSLV
jgi:hypothetical protein